MTPDEWLNTTSFGARLFGNDVERSASFAIWGLREGLEDRPSAASDPDDYDCKVAVACEWFIQAGPRLLRLCSQSPNKEFEEWEKTSHCGATYGLVSQG